MGKGSHDPQADEPAKLAARTLTMKRSASRDLLGDALDCAASCIDAAALDAYRLDYASSASAPRYPDTSFRCVLRSRRRPHAVDASPACHGARRAAEKTKKRSRFENAGTASARCAARRENSRRPTTTRPP